MTGYRARSGEQSRGNSRYRWLAFGSELAGEGSLELVLSSGATLSCHQWQTAKIVTTHADVAPGNAPDPAAAALTAAAEAGVAPLVSQVVGFATLSYTRDGGSTGESSLGDIIADSQNAASVRAARQKQYFTLPEAVQVRHTLVSVRLR